MCIRDRKKYRMFLYGMIVAALGISMITKAELGTSPITSPSYVLTFIFPYSLGVFVLAVNSTLFLFECLVLGRSFKKIQLLQLPATLIFSACIDGWMWVLSFWTPVFYVQKVLLLLAGCAALGLGVALEVVPDVLILPGEGLVRAVSRRKNWDFGIGKTCFDMSVVLTAVLLSVLCLGHVEGIRAVSYTHLPEVKIFNCSVNMSYSSVCTYYARMYESKFLMGALAASMAQCDKLGYIADYPIYGTIANINALSLIHI